MSGIQETVRQHAKVIAILVVFTASAVTLLSRELPSFAAPDAYAVLETARGGLSGDSIRPALESVLILLVLVTLGMAGYHVKLLLAGRAPRTEHEEGLLQYILLARQHGFAEDVIIDRLAASGWDREAVESALQEANGPAGAQTLKKGHG